MGKKTPFYEEQVNRNGKMVEFAGYMMPIQFDRGIIAEHHQVRTKAGLFDVSHMGEVRVVGKQALDFVDYLVTNNCQKLIDGQILYTPMCYENGTIVDDLLVYRLHNEEFFLVINASNVEKDFLWMQNVAEKFQVSLTNESDEYAQLAIQGPLAEKILSETISQPLSEIQYFHFTHFEYNNVKLLVSRTGYTGEDGFEIYLPNAGAADLYKNLMEKGGDDLWPIGLGARDTLRFEAKLPLYGNDIDDTTTPLEAGLGWCVKLDKPDFSGKEVLVNQKKQGIQRKLMGFKMLDKQIPRHHYNLFSDEKQIGYVTSGTRSPSLEMNLGLGYMEKKFAKIGTVIQVEVRGKKYNAEIIKTPFYHRES